MSLGKPFWKQQLNSTCNNRDKDRYGSFSLIHLEPNEYVLEDYSCSISINNYVDPVEIDSKTIQKAKFVNYRLWICSRSLVFERSNVSIATNEPIIRIAFNNFTNILFLDASYSFNSNNSSSKTGLMYLSSNSFTEIFSGQKLQCSQYRQSREFLSIFVSFHYVLTRTVCNLINETWSNSINMDANNKNPDYYSSNKSKSTENKNKEDTFENQFLNTQRRSFTFDRSMLDDICEEFIFETSNCWLCEPLVRCAGYLTLTNKRLYFIPFRPGPCGSQNVRINLDKVQSIRNRRYLLSSTACEIVYGSQNCIYLVFGNQSIKDSFTQKFLQLNLPIQYYLSEKTSCVDNKVTKSWLMGELSNYDYLMYLNLVGDRSFMDLSQYPIFPWIISDYSSEEARLDDPTFYRDLRLPIGALNRQRLRDLKRKVIIKKEMENELGSGKNTDSIYNPNKDSFDATVGSYLYGSHYSTPAMALYFLVRAAPEHALCVQGGRFDVADRLFSSIQTSWNNCTSNHSDFKELVPEFYDFNGEIFKNCLKLDLGLRQDGHMVNDVVLPPWAKNDPKKFVDICRQALEHPIVSANLHNWIDLIFGYKQRGPESWVANNVFHPLTYEGSIDLNSVTNSCLRNCLETQILEFGQCPRQLFTHPHPVKMKDNIYLSITFNPSSFLKNIDDGVFECLDTDDNEPKGCYSTSTNNKSSANFDIISVKTFSNHSSQNINAIWLSPDGALLIIISQDGCMSIHNIENENIQTKTYKISSKPLTCINVLRHKWDNKSATFVINSVDRISSSENLNVNHDRNSMDLMVVVSGNDQILRLCNAHNGMQTNIEVFNEMVQSISIDGFWMAVGCNDGSIHVYHYDILSKPVVFSKYSIMDHNSAIRSLELKVSSVNNSEPWLISSDNDSNLSSWNIILQDSTSIKTNENISFVKWSITGDYILTSSDSGEISIYKWDYVYAKFASSNPLAQCRFGDRISPVNWLLSSLVDSSEFVTIYGWMGDVAEIIIWNWKSMKIYQRILVNSSIPSFIDNINNLFACATNNGQITVWTIVKKLM